MLVGYNMKKYFETKIKIKGFTLVELLIVVLVISILSGVTLGVLNSKGVKAKARDSQRIADLKKIQTALELYFSDNRTYPPTTGWATVSLGLIALAPSYMNVLPVDPVNDASNGDICNGVSEYAYGYYSATGTNYYLGATMEVDTSDESSPCDSLYGWSSVCSSGDTFGVEGDVCYGVQNP